MTAIFIKQLKLMVIVGVFAKEREQPQEIVLDIKLTVDVQAAIQSDNVNDTINYAELCQSLQCFVDTTQCQLIETLADQIIKFIKRNYPVKHVSLTLYKKPFDMPQVESVGIEIAG